jgi:hypothetical protein
VSRSAAWFVHGSVALAGATGLVYGWMRYVAEPADEWAIVNHPWEPDLKALHIVLVPLLVFGCGLLWRTHVWERIRTEFPHRRRTGIALALLLAPMVASGYAVQVAEDQTWRAVWMWTHGLTSCAWVLMYLVHQLSEREE